MFLLRVSAESYMHGERFELAKQVQDCETTPTPSYVTEKFQNARKHVITDLCLLSALEEQLNVPAARTLRREQQRDPPTPAKNKRPITTVALA